MTKRENAEEDYMTTPISVLSYITELESQLEEAREEIQDLRNIGNCFKQYVPPNLRDLYNEQLKEKSDEI